MKVPSQGQVNLNTVLSAIGAGGTLIGANGCGNNFLSNLLGGCNRGGCSPADTPVTRYEMAMQQQLAAKDSEIMELKANIFTDQKITETYKELRAMITGLQDFAARQSVQNQAFIDSFADVRKDVDYKVQLEAERRQCADCKIVNYVNSTFAPKLITDYGAGTTSAAAQVYNPLGCGCGCGNIYSTPA